jgi:hypothetical protein
MQISSSMPRAKGVPAPTPQASKAEVASEGSSFGDSVKDFYDQNKSAIHLGGGALLGAGIAMYGGGLTGTAVVSAAGSGALGGFFAGDDSQKALYMGGGALIGATIASMAGVPGTAVMSAAGTGALLGFLFG